MAATQSLPLHTSNVPQPRATINRLHTILHFFAILALLYYRVSSLFIDIYVISSFFPWVLITASEFLLSFNWVLGQAFRWRPIRRTVYPERLPGDEELPPIDVFICTADPKKEPTMDVMNTVLSAMCLDYPPDKLSVYLSDDAGAPITLFAMREAFSFAMSWVPFCRIYGLKTRYPEAYFGSESVDDDEEHNGDGTAEFVSRREEIKFKYKMFRQRLEKASGNEEMLCSPQDRPSLIEVIGGHESDEVLENNATFPLLVYVSREKRRSHPHHFKAGALNVLLRVSALISNAPYVLSLDCDMYCNDPTSARQAMCFHLDPQISPSLTFVQFPQDFRNWNKNDIYNDLITSVFKVLWHGVDGLKGPWLVGTGFFLKRESLFRRSPFQDLDPIPSTRCFGPSKDFIASLYQNQKTNIISGGPGEELNHLASCTYEKDAQWGEEIGFMYHCVVEDYFTGFILHSKGWNSVYCDPSRPAFLGCVATNLNDCLVQTTRWEAGFLQVGLSRFCPLIYRSSKMSILQRMCYAFMALQSLNSISLLCYAIVPQFCLFKAIPLYPKVSSPWFYVIATVYASSRLQHLFETRSIGGTLQLWWNQHRICMMKSVTSYFLACLDLVMKWIGRKEIKFVPTNKVANNEQEQRYNVGVFDFQVGTIFLLPLATIVNLNIACLVLGLGRSIIDATYHEMFGQIFLSFVILILGYPIIEGMIIRRDSGRIPTSVTLSSVALVCVIISLGYAYD